jgi:large subunit ribosomal protein L22
MSEIRKKYTKLASVGRYILMSPRKVRRVLNQIRGKNYKEALMLLQFMPYRACGPVSKIIYSAATNAEHNLNLNKKKLFICEAFANQGPIFRRFRPRAKGQGFEIRKPSCHIIISVQEKTLSVLK